MWQAIQFSDCKHGGRPNKTVSGRYNERVAWWVNYRANKWNPIRRRSMQQLISKRQPSDYFSVAQFSLFFLTTIVTTVCWMFTTCRGRQKEHFHLNIFPIGFDGHFVKSPFATLVSLPVPVNKFVVHTQSVPTCGVPNRKCSDLRLSFLCSETTGGI